MIGIMWLIMNDGNLQTIEQVKEFLGGSSAIDFAGVSAKEKKAWIEEVLVRFEYLRLRRNEKGVIRRYIQKMAGYSRTQTCRLIGEYRREGKIGKEKKGQRHRFATKYSERDIELLARTDELHGCLGGPATRKIMQRECEVYGHSQFGNISRISISHLYNLRKSRRYRDLNIRFRKTKPVVSNIGERIKPDPQGRPGYIRVDTVHQGDRDGQKGVYHINTIDEVTQWEGVASVEKISENYLAPAVENLMADFPFAIRGFHTDNGSEFVNKTVASLLNRLLVRFTKCRPRHSNDNGLIECKNGAVIRKQFGYAHIPQKHADVLNDYHRTFLNPYINFHRPCHFPVSVVDEKGKVKKTYPPEEVMTPYERLKSLPQSASLLRPGLTFEVLEARANELSDNEFAERMEKTRSNLFERILVYR